MATPIWVLTGLYWIHILATITWLGSQGFWAWIKSQEARGGSNQVLYAGLVQTYQRRLIAVGWLSLMLLAATGMFQMSANINYRGFLAIVNTWAVAILVKHILYAVLIASNLYLTWGLTPAMDRTRLRVSRGLATAGEAILRLKSQETWLIRFNLGLTVVILIFTALARST